MVKYYIYQNTRGIYEKVDFINVYVYCSELISSM